MSGRVVECDFLVIGSGPAGQKAAIQGAKAGQRVVLVERDQRLGGICVNRGTIPSKALRENAVRQPRLVDAAIELLPMLSRVGAIVNAHDDFNRAQLDRNGIVIEVGVARFSAPGVVMVRSLRGENLEIRPRFTFIATGSTPRHPENIPIDHEKVFDSDSILAMAYVPESIIVIGGGVIGSEYASIFARLGASVTIVDRQGVPLAFLDHEISMRFRDSLAQRGASFIGNSVVRSASTSISGVQVELADSTRLHAEKLLVAQGRVASVSSLNLEAIGLEPNERGLLPTDAYGETPVPGVYAVGDVQGPPLTGVRSNGPGPARCTPCAWIT